MYNNIVKYSMENTIKILKKNAPLSELIKIVNKENVKALAVVNEANKLIGIIDSRQLSDIILKQFPKKTAKTTKTSKTTKNTKSQKNDNEILNKEISSFMSKDFITAYPEDDLEKIFDSMLKNKLEYIAVIDDKNKPIGTLNIYDLYETIIKLKIRNVGLNISLIEEKSSIEKDNVIKNLIKEIDTLNAQSTIDARTGLYNVRYFNKVIEEEVERAIRYNYSISIIFMDLDHFKNVNDIYGHNCGNFILHELGSILNNPHDNILRKSDIAVRYGGEEFLIICPNTKKEQAYILGERIRKTIEKKAFSYEKNIINITISIGISEYKPSSKQIISDTIKEADSAMYEAKRLGRNKTFIYKYK